MATVKIFKAPHRSEAYWNKTMRKLRVAGYDVYREYEDADVSIVLSGKAENPSGFKGKRVLFYRPSEWLVRVPPPHGFLIYKPVLEIYYDEMYDVTGLTVKECSQKIIEYIGGLDV